MRIRTALVSLAASVVVSLPLAVTSYADTAGAESSPEMSAAAGCTPYGYLATKNYGNIRFSGEAKCSGPTLTHLTLEGQRQGTGFWAQMVLTGWPYNYTYGSGIKYAEALCRHPNSTYRSKVTSNESGATRVGSSSGRTVAC